MDTTLGILGGMGPYAALAFVRLIMRATPATCDADHLHIILDNRTSIPSRYAAALDGAESPVAEMVRGFHALAAAGAHCVAVPCNAAHFFRNQVQSQVKLPWLSMIELVGSAVAASFQRPVIVGAVVTARFHLYADILPEAMYVSPMEAPVVGKIIDCVKAGGEPDDSLLDQLSKQLRVYAREADCVLLACTELAEIKASVAVALPVIDSSSVYAERVLEVTRTARNVAS